MAEVLDARDVAHRLRGYNSHVFSSVKTSLYGVNTVRFSVKILWQTLPIEFKRVPIFGDF